MTCFPWPGLSENAARLYDSATGSLGLPTVTGRVFDLLHAPDRPRMSPQSSQWQERVVLAYIDEPPFGKTGPDGRALGCDVDLALIVLHAIGVKKVETHLATFAELLPGVASGRWTINVPLFVTPERAASVSFSRPVWALHDGLIVPSGNPKKLASYRAIAEGHDTRLGVVTGQVQRDAAIRSGVAPVQIIEFATQHDVVEALLAGKIDAYASTAVGNRTFVRESANLGLLAVELDVSAASPEVAVPVGAFSFARSNIELRKRFDEYLAHYLGSQEHRERMASQGLSAREIDPISPSAGTSRLE